MSRYETLTTPRTAVLLVTDSVLVVILIHILMYLFVFFTQFLDQSSYEVLTAIVDAFIPAYTLDYGGTAGN